MGADDLLANGHDVAVINYHSGDVYDNTYGLARLSYYNLNGTPTAWFGGVSSVVGGNHTNSMYSTYLPKYNQRKAIQSSFTIDIEGANSGLIDYELEITIEKVAPTSANNIKLHVAVTEYGIMQSWQGQSILNSVERLMAPNHLGTNLDFSGGDVIVETINFTMDEDWVNDNCEVVVFLQDNGTKEVLQGTKRDISDFGSTNTYDASIKKVYSPNASCTGYMEPKAFIANYGLENLTSLDIIYYVDEGDQYTYDWTGNLAYLETAIIDLPGFDYTVMGSNQFTVKAENPNGQPDQVPFNNIVIKDFNAAQNVSSPVVLALKLDDNPGETSWELRGDDGTVLYSGGDYTTAGQFIIEEFGVPDQGCYTFIIFDEGADGLTGAGIYKLAYDGSTIFAQGTEFGHQDETHFGINLTNTDESVFEAGMMIYPNPFENQAFVSFTTNKTETVNLEVYNALGEVVYQLDNRTYSAGTHAVEINSSKFNSGIYFVHLTIGENIYIEKVLHSK
jgi:hypothetical protein